MEHGDTRWTPWIFHGGASTVGWTKLVSRTVLLLLDCVNIKHYHKYNCFDIFRLSRHIALIPFRLWTVISGDWSTSWQSVTDVKHKAMITNPTKTWWLQLTSMWNTSSTRSTHSNNSYMCISEQYFHIILQLVTSAIRNFVFMLKTMHSF